MVLRGELLSPVSHRFRMYGKEFGFNAVIYLAALTGISLELYEAAAIDGCSRWKAVWNITIPGIAKYDRCIKYSRT